jgi:hypothetical protein
MKKIIATLSVVLMSACAIALANDSDSRMNNSASDTSTSDTTGNAAGIAGSDMNNTNANTTLNNDAATMNHGTDVNSDSTTTTMTKKTAKISKSCTDESGNVFKKGESGFKSCMKAQHEQSGIAADQSSNSGVDSKMNSDVPSHSSTY